jgi:hypothetical protein
MRNLYVTLLFAAAAAPSMAMADSGLSYSYLDPAYITTNVDNFDKDVDGFALRGSLAVTDQVFGFAGYSDQSTDIGGSSLHFSTLNIGAGYRWPVSSTADVYGKLGYVDEEARYRGNSADDSGILLGAGLRGRFEQFELEGSLNFVDLSDSGNDTSLGLGARWFFTQTLAAGVEAQVGGDATTYGLGMRWNWGN